MTRPKPRWWQNPFLWAIPAIIGLAGTSLWLTDQIPVDDHPIPAGGTSNSVPRSITENSNPSAVPNDSSTHPTVLPSPANDSKQPSRLNPPPSVPPKPELVAIPETPSERITKPEESNVLPKKPEEEMIAAKPVVEPTKLASPVSPEVASSEPVDAANLPQIFRGHRLPVRALAVSANGQFAVSAGGDKTLRSWNLQSGKEILQFDAAQSREYVDVKLSPDGELVAAADSDGKLSVWELRTGRPKQRIQLSDGGINCLTFSADGTHLIGGCQDHLVRMWDVETGDLVREWVGHNGAVLCVAASADGTQLASGGDDYTAYIWNISKLPPFEKLRADNPILSIAWSADSRIVVGATETQIRLWNPRTGQTIKPMHGPQPKISTAILSPNGEYVLTGSNDNSLVLWSLKTGQPQLDWKSLTTGTERIAWSRGSNVVLVGGGPVLKSQPASIADSAAFRRVTLPDFALSIPPTKPPVPINTQVASTRPTVPDPPMKEKDSSKPAESAIPLADSIPIAAGDLLTSPLPKDAMRFAIPKDAELEQVRATFKNELAASTGEPETVSLSDRAKQLFQKAEEQDRDVVKFVFLQAARQQAVSAGDVELTALVVQRQAELFAFDYWNLRCQTARAIFPILRKNDPKDSQVSLQALDLIAGFLQENRPDDIADLFISAPPTSRSNLEEPVAALLKLYDKQLKLLQKESPLLKDALTELKEKPDDPLANTKAGQFYCLTVGNWDLGLKYLERGADKELAKLALRDLECPLDNPTEWLEMGQAWFAHAQKQPASLRLRWQLRARHWLTKGLGYTKGTQKSATQELLAKIPGTFGHVRCSVELAKEKSAEFRFDGAGFHFLPSDGEIPARLLLAGRPWNLQERPDWENRRELQVLPEGVDPKTARLVQVGGRSLAVMTTDRDSVRVQLRTGGRKETIEFVLFFGI